MKVSIITATYNSEKFIKTNIESVNNQTYQNIEHIIIDNKSNDNTLSIAKKNGKNLRIFSDNDKGIYDAFNKGINEASGEIISILNSDDFYTDREVLKEVVNAFETKNTEIVYGNLVYVKRSNESKIVRYWKSNSFVENSFKFGWSPPHPTFFVKRKTYQKFGNFKLNYGNASDIELMFRLLEKNKIKSYYLNKTLVTMRYGGKSNNNIYEIFKQNYKILEILNFKANPFLIFRFLICKIYERFKQLIFRKQ